jgi:hypothetical protein
MRKCQLTVQSEVNGWTSSWECPLHDHSVFLPSLWPWYLLSHVRVYDYFQFPEISTDACWYQDLWNQWHHIGGSRRPVAKATATIFPESTWLTSHLYQCYIITHVITHIKRDTPPPPAESLFHSCPLPLSLPINLLPVELLWPRVLCLDGSHYSNTSILKV